MQNPKYAFYLNLHDEYRWTKCPKCDTKTKVRKFCLMIKYEDKSVKFNQLTSLNKSCKFCTSCQLIILQKAEIEILLNQIIPQYKEDLNFNSDNYLIFGTMDRKYWKKNIANPLNATELLSAISPFKDVLDFKIKPAGWYFEDEK